MKPLIAAAAVALAQGVIAVADGRTVGTAIGAGIFFFLLTWAIASWMGAAKKGGSSGRKLAQEDIPLWRGTHDTPLRDR